MEKNQTQQMVSWLDEERRKDKALITKLEERASAQSALIEDQARRIQALEGQIASVKAAQLSSAFFNETISRLRSDLQQSIDKLEERRTSVDQDIKRLRDQDREAFNRAVEELRQEIDKRFEREMQPRRIEEERLSRAAAELQVYADNLSKGLEDFERSLAFLEEQRRQDAKRLADTSNQVLEVAKRQETQLTKIELLEELSRRNERTTEDIQGTITEIKQQRKSWAEQEALAAQRRDQAIDDVLRRMEHFEETAEGYVTQFSSYGETHRDMRKTIDDFARLADRVDRRLNEFGEVQRIAEDRFRQEFEQFLADDQKRWRQFTLTNEEAWRENNKAVTALTTKVETFGVRFINVTDHIRFLHKQHKTNIRELADSFRTVAESVEDGGTDLPPLD
jgi:hypothetical protein